MMCCSRLPCQPPHVFFACFSPHLPALPYRTYRAYRTVFTPCQPHTRMYIQSKPPTALDCVVLYCTVLHCIAEPPTFLTSVIHRHPPSTSLFCFKRCAPNLRVNINKRLRALSPLPSPLSHLRLILRPLCAEPTLCGRKGGHAYNIADGSPT